MAAEVALTAEARKNIKDLKNVVIAARIYEIIDRLSDWPEVSGAKALRGNLAGRYRIRTGDYRLQFRVDIKREERVQDAGEGKPQAGPRYKVIVEKVGHRDRFYED
jgi:mRNA-degrading endonuclease RelE of RelBE toxin-antitoxin system